MRHRMNVASEEYGLNFSLIATPAEGLSGRFTKIDKSVYGEIPGVTDREYYTNSFHVPVYHKISAFEKRLINWKNLIKHLIRKNQKKVIISLICIVILAIAIKVIPKDLKMHFIDVGQGDATLIVTPRNKTILIDGGGSENYDIGKNTLLPYLLDRKITKIDYVIISHFDTDHVDGILTILKVLKVGKVIIGRQYETSANYEEFVQIFKEKKNF